MGRPTGARAQREERAASPRGPLPGLLPLAGRNGVCRASRRGSSAAPESSAWAGRRSRRFAPVVAAFSSWPATRESARARLLDELRELAEGEGSSWLEGRCVSYGESLPYWPFRDLLRGEWIGAGAEEPELRVRVGLRRRLDQLFDGKADELYPYLGGLLEVALEHEAAARTAQLSPEALQWRTFEVVGQLFARLAETAPLVLAFEDLHWADPTSVLLLEQLLSLAEEAPVLLVLSLRPERDHPLVGPARARGPRVPAPAARDRPRSARRRRRRTARRARRARDAAGRARAARARGRGRESVLPRGARPFARRRRSARSHRRRLALRPRRRGRGAADRGEGDPRAPRPALAAGSRPRHRRLRARAHVRAAAARRCARETSPPESLHELQRLGLLRQSRRWPQPEYRFRHALIQETAYRTLLAEQRTRLHRRAAEWLEERYAGRDAEVLGLLAYHWLRAEDEEKAADYLLRAGDKARLEYALDEAIEHYRDLLPLLERRGERQEIALVLFKLALALHTSLRFAEANEAYQRAFGHWTPPEPPPGRRVRAPDGGELRPAATRSEAARVVAQHPALHAALRPPRRSLARAHDRAVAGRALGDLRRRAPLRLLSVRGADWSDGAPLTANDVEFGIKRVLDPTNPGARSPSISCSRTPRIRPRPRERRGSVGVRALDDRTVEFRLVAPAPYFMSVINRPDAGPQPRHAIELHGEAWSRPSTRW